MRLVFLLLVSLVSSYLVAQDKSITVEISPDSVLMDNELEVNFIIENVEVQKFEAPPFKDFEVMAGPFSSSMMSMINGEVSSKQTYTYIIKPKRPGAFYIEPAFAEIKEGEALETHPIEVKVYANPDGIIQKKNPRNQDWDGFFNRSKPQKNKTKAKPERKTFKI